MRFVVTGASRGLGLSLVSEIGRRGHHAWVCVRDPGSAIHAQKLVAANPERLRLMTLDVTSDASCEALAVAVADSPIDCVVNNAAIGTFEPFASATSDELLRQYDTNAVGSFRVTRALLPALGRARGRIVHVSSDMASLGAGPAPKSTALAYRMSKAALNMLSVSLASELRESGVTSVAVHPGWMNTDMGDGPLDPSDVATRLVTMCESLGIESTGRFLDLDGRTIDW